MKLSIGLFAAVSAVGTDDPAFERPAICNEYDGTFVNSDNIVNCWSPSGHFASVHNDNGTEVSYYQTNDGGECGFQYIDTELSLVNKTCTFVPADVDGSYDIGNAVFVAKGPNAAPNEIVGFDITGDFNYVQKWDVQFNFADEFNQELNDYIDAVDYANKNNSTQPEPFSFDKTYACANEIENLTPPSNCQDNGRPYQGYAIMFTNQHAGDKNNNYAIANYHQGIGTNHVFSVSINKPCQQWGFTEHDPNQGTIQMLVQDANECMFTVTVGENHGAQLFYFQGSIDEGVIDFFNDVTIA